jgi:hypothetical protein
MRSQGDVQHFASSHFAPTARTDVIRQFHGGRGAAGRGVPERRYNCNARKPSKPSLIRQHGLNPQAASHVTTWTAIWQPSIHLLPHCTFQPIRLAAGMTRQDNRALYNTSFAPLATDRC